MKDFWDKLPTEVKVAFYYAGAAGLNLIAQELLSLEPINWELLVRILAGNMFLVFVQKLPERLK